MGTRNWLAVYFPGTCALSSQLLKLPKLLSLGESSTGQGSQNRIQDFCGVALAGPPEPSPASAPLVLG